MTLIGLTVLILSGPPAAKDKNSYTHAEMAKTAWVIPGPSS